MHRTGGEQTGVLPAQIGIQCILNNIYIWINYRDLIRYDHGHLLVIKHGSEIRDTWRFYGWDVFLIYTPKSTSESS